MTVTPAVGRLALPRRVDARAIGIALVVASACGYGSGPIFAKPAYAAGVDWMTLLFWRFTIAAALSWAWLLLVPGNRASFRLLTRRRALIMLALGVFFVGNSATYYAGLETVPASLAALIVFIYPALVAVMSLRFGRRLRGRRAWAALGLAMVGVTLAIGNIPAASAPPLSGLVLVAASPVIYAVWIILAARLGGERREERGGPRRAAEPSAATIPPPDAEMMTRPAETDPAPAAAVMTTGTAAVYLAGMLLTGHSIAPQSVPSDAWVGLIGVGVFSTALAVQAFYAGARRVGAARASLISTLEPLYTIVFAAILLGEMLSPIQMFGGTLIIFGVLLAESGQAAEPAAPGSGADRATVVA